MSSQESIREEKHPSIAYLLWGLGFVGICGLHRMYLGQYQMGTAMLFTFGLFGVGQLIDVAMINQAVQEANSKAGVEVPVVVRPNVPDIDAHSKRTTESTPDEVDELDLEQASIEETMKKLRE
jgi:TM2 domain-containing membrane protein YozV